LAYWPLKKEQSHPLFLDTSFIAGAGGNYCFAKVSAVTGAAMSSFLQCGSSGYLQQIVKRLQG
jgi:hypothetical protein